MNNAEARAWLDREWQSVLEAPVTETDPEIDRLVDSRIVSIRYAVVTQLLGKITDPRRGLLYLQSGSGEAGAWDARSFCKSVIVPWVSDNHNVIGTSADPYVGKPLRRPRLERSMDNVRDKRAWECLVELFLKLDQCSPDELKEAYRRVLRGLARKLEGQSFRYPIPKRVSLPVLLDVLNEYLDSPSGGFRAQAVTPALLGVIGEGFSLFTKVESQALNEADSASGMPGDVMCYGEDNRLALAVEVKQGDLTLTDVRTSTQKVLESDDRLSQFLFASPGIQKKEKEEIKATMDKFWASGLNLYHTDIMGLAATTFVLLDEDYRPKLLRQVGVELDNRGNHHHRRVWYKLMDSLNPREEKKKLST